jgi:hypothetical protein
MSTTRTWRPSRKWLATQCTAAATVAVAWVNEGAWTKPLSIAMIGLVSQAIVGYLVSNGDPSPTASSTGASPGGGLVTATGAQSTTA